MSHRITSIFCALLLATAACEFGGGENYVLLTTTTTDNFSQISTVTGVPTSTTSAGTEGDTEDTEGDTEVTITEPMTTGPTAVCGNGIVEGDEECDDGNKADNDDCTNACKLPVCGDGIVWKGVEHCDDGNESDNDACPTTCRDAKCGDGFLYFGFEECDDGNEDNDDDCTNACKFPVCGDGFVHQGYEVCDHGGYFPLYGGCAPDCMSLGPHCGDGILQKQFEQCDSKSPHPGLLCNDFCKINFEKADQMYCHTDCSWDPITGCGQGDADMFCRLKLRSSYAYAVSFVVGKPHNGHGFPCGNSNTTLPNDTRIDLGIVGFGYGVKRPILWQTKGIADNHPEGETLRNIVCDVKPD